jgi:hypothetical protein
VNSEKKKIEEATRKEEARRWILVSVTLATERPGNMIFAQKTSELLGH